MNDVAAVLSRGIKIYLVLSWSLSFYYAVG